MSSSEERISALISKCKLSNDVDVKVDVVTQLQREFETGTELGETEELMNTLKASLRSSHQHLCIAALSTTAALYVLLTQNKASNTHHELATLRQYLNIFLPSTGIIEKLGDAKEKVREKAQQTLFSIGNLTVKAGNLSSIQSSKGRESRALETPFQVFERLIREQGLSSKNWRIREQTIMTLVQLRRIHTSFPLKPFVPGLVDSLESSDGTVRECAKQAVIEIFTGANVSDTAKSELKKEMMKKNVRKSILDVVLSKIFNPESDKTLQGLDNVENRDNKNDHLVSKPSAGAHSLQNMNMESENPNQTNLTTSEITPVYIASARDLESEFAKMLPAFEGRETEQNWLERERSVSYVRSLLKGDVHSRFPEAFIACLKNGFLEGSLKAAASLRTTLASNTCSLYNDLAVSLGPGLDSFVEMLLIHLLRMAGYTKKIIATQSQVVVSSILKYTTPLPRQVLPLLWVTLQEKAVQTRTFVIEHFKTFLDHHGANCKHAIESANGTDLLDKCLRKGLTDVNPGVREKSRLLFWSFETIWKDRAAPIYESLDAPAKKQLQNACPSGASLKLPIPTTKKSSIAASIAATRAKAQQVALIPPSLKQQVQSTPPAQNGTHSPPRFSPPTTVKVSRFPRAGKDQSGSPSPLSNPQTRSSLSFQKRQRGISISSSSSSPPPSPIKDLHKRRTSSSFVVQTAHAAAPSNNISSILDADISLDQSQFPVFQSPLRPQGHQPTNNNRDSLLMAVELPLPLDADEIAESNHDFEAADEPTLSRITAPSDTSAHSLSSPTPSRLNYIPTSIVEDALRARAAQAESAAEQLLELVEPDEDLHISPIPASLLPHTAASVSPKLNLHRTSMPMTPVNQKSSVMRQVALFQDSPLLPDRSPSLLDIIEERKHQSGWWLRRISVLGQNKNQVPNDPAERIEMIDGCITELDRGGRGDLHLLQKLLTLCQQQRSGETGTAFSDNDASSSQALAGTSSSDDIWDNGVRADRLFNSLNQALQPDKDPEFLTYGLFILLELLPRLDGRDGDVLALLLRLRYAQDYNVDEGTVIIRDAQVELMNERNYTLYGLSTMSVCLKNFLSHPEPGSVLKDVKLRAHAFGLITMAKFIVKLPADILEEELPKIKSSLLDAYLSSQAVVRQAATTAITAAQVILRDEAHLFALLGPLPDDKKNLLTYFFEKNNARGSVTRQGDHDGMDKLYKEMVRLDQRISTPPRLRS